MNKDELELRLQKDRDRDKSIISKPIEQVLHESMMPYSEFVILDRALPRVEDGLKPVQRRVLFSMYETGVFPDRPYKKSATQVGYCMGRYHPHGDSSIYETLVRLAQDFNMGEVLVDGHGNFGSIDGDGAAAMRYTEAKLAPIALEMLRDIEKDTVHWSFTFDDSNKEPDVLPSRFPNLLVNGSQGIAVGLSTNIPTHNLNEVIDLTIAYINNRHMSLDDMLKIMPGPDFPTGAYILNTSEIRQLYEIGKGKVIIRSKYHIENADNGKKNIVFTEIPYQVNKSNLEQRIAKVKETDETGHLAFISDIVDESDRNGIRVVVKLKKDANIHAILALLFKLTPLQSTFNANMVAIADKKPRQMSLRDILEYYVNFQQQVILNRTKYDLDLCEKKAHILEGLLVAINNIDEVIRIIKQSKSTNEAKVTLKQTFSLDDIQAQAILDMRLAKLTNLEVTRLKEDLNMTLMLIKKYKAIIASPTLQMQIVKEDLTKIKQTYPRPRKSQFIDDNDESQSTTIESHEIVNDVYGIVSPDDCIKVVPVKNYNLSTKGLSANASISEIPSILWHTTTDKTIYIFTDKGYCHSLDMNEISEARYKDKGQPLKSLIKNFESDEHCVSVIELDENNNKEDYLLFVTQMGMIKISRVDEYLSSKQSIGAIKLKEGDKLIYVYLYCKEKQLALFTNTCMSVLVDTNDIEPSGRLSIGVKGILLADKDFVVGATQCGSDDIIALFGSDGYCKLLKQNALPHLPRNRKGLKVTITKGVNGNIRFVDKIDGKSNYVCDTVEGLVYVPSKNIKLCDRTSLSTNFKGGKTTITTNAVYKYSIE